MALKSLLYKKEEIINKDKEFGAAETYFPFWVVDENGKYNFALLTQRELELAIGRGKKNPEDIVPTMPLLHRVWDNLLRLVKIR